MRDFILDRGFIGLPPEGATPSAPESGELVLHWLGEERDPRLERRHPPPLVRAWVYADGRIIWSRGEPALRVPEGATELTSGYLEQRLTPEGVELLRSEVVGLLDRSRALLSTVPAETVPDRSTPVRVGLFVPNRTGGGQWKYATATASSASVGGRRTGERV